MIVRVIVILCSIAIAAYWFFSGIAAAHPWLTIFAVGAIIFVCLLVSIVRSARTGTYGAGAAAFRFVGAAFGSHDNWTAVFFFLVTAVLGCFALVKGGGETLLFSMPAHFEKKAPSHYSDNQQKVYNALFGSGVAKTNKEIVDEKKQSGRLREQSWFWVISFVVALIWSFLFLLWALRQEVVGGVLRLAGWFVHEGRRIAARREVEGGLPTSWERFVMAVSGLRPRPPVVVQGAAATQAAQPATTQTTTATESVWKRLGIEFGGELLGHWLLGRR